MVKVPPWQCPSLVAAAAPQGAPGGSGQLGHSRLGHWAPRRCLGYSSSIVTDSTAFDSSGAARRRRVVHAHVHAGRRQPARRRPAPLRLL
eukprot:scaffold52073_cov51-Phaeocystis_antarctica.AAC.1